MSSWFETTDARTVYEGRSTVRVETVRMPGGEEVEREIVDRSPAVAVVVVTDDDEVILLKQYRQAVRSYVLEIPAGTLDDEDPSPEAAARRELAEEAHFEPDGLVELTTFLNSAGWTTERTHVYLAEGGRPVPPPEGFEAEHEEADMEVVRLPLPEALALVRAGELTDAKSVIGLLLAASRRGA